MTRRLPLIIGIAVAALAVVPTAFGQGSEQSATVASTYRDAFERAIVQSQVPQTAVSGYRDSHERGLANESEPQWLKALNARSEGLNRLHGLGEFAQSNVSTMSPSERAEMLRGKELNRIYGLGEFATTARHTDAFERGGLPPVSPAPVSIAAADRDIEWPQVGVGLGIGIVLMIGFALAVRATRTRPLAH